MAGNSPLFWIDSQLTPFYFKCLFTLLSLLFKKVICLFVFFSFIFISWRLTTSQYCSGFVIHWHESAMDLHVFLIWISFQMCIWSFLYCYLLNLQNKYLFLNWCVKNYCMIVSRLRLKWLTHCFILQGDKCYAEFFSLYFGVVWEQNSPWKRVDGLQGKVLWKSPENSPWAVFTFKVLVTQSCLTLCNL